MSWLQKALNASVSTAFAEIQVRANNANNANSAKSSPNGTDDTKGTGRRSSAVIYTLRIFAAALEEQAGIAQHDGGVPRYYASAFAEFQYVRPDGASQERWQMAVDDVGLFLDSYPNGTDGKTLVIIWPSAGRTVVALTKAGAWLQDQSFMRRCS